MTDQFDGDDLPPELSAALAVASWAVTAPACCPRCRQVFVHCAACGELCCLRVPPDDDLPAALSGECVSCSTPGLVTVAGWLNPTPKPKVKVAGGLPLSSTKLAAHLERCLQSGDGQRHTPQRAAAQPRRPLPPASQREVADRLRLTPAPSRCIYAAWREDLEPDGLVLPTAAALAASYRRLTGLGPVLHPNSGSAMYSETELVACFTELRIPLPADFVLPGSLLHHFHRWLLVELRTVRGDT